MDVESIIVKALHVELYIVVTACVLAIMILALAARGESCGERAAGSR